MNRQHLCSYLSRQLLLVALLVFCISPLLAGCAASEANEPELAQRTSLELMDWHVSGLWVINCPVVWVRVTNYNDVPIKEVTFQYNTFDVNGKPLDEGTYTIEGTVAPHTTKNFIELYVGLVDLYSERLSLKLDSVHRG